MEEMKITRVMFNNDSDLSIMDLVINTDAPRPALSVPVNDDANEPYHVELRLDIDTGKVVGAMIMPSNSLFDELARAFASRDLNHPDVRFFLEKKLELYAERHREELESALTSPVTPTPP